MREEEEILDVLGLNKNITVTSEEKHPFQKGMWINSHPVFPLQR